MKNNKGFSMVELIIVVAIMAILVGLIAPVMLHCIEKSTVSSDYQLADTVRSCLSYSIVDAKVKEDPASQPDLNAMEAGPIDIATLDDGSVLKDSATEYLGVDPATLATQIRSKH
ncbi:MAG: prepilin-type N-terminal cleavage/methylation domain-containing protein, partial [Lachnospiraceae bacterium]|nr:prepilin-type N-terminal cleavage/methylation domain-containing protein [Lachnospiraceae bacterium]